MLTNPPQHTLLQHFSGLRNLHALHISPFRNDDTCAWAMQETTKFFIDSLVWYPRHRLEWLGVGERVTRIVRAAARPVGSRKGGERKKDGGEEGKGKGVVGGGVDKKGKGKAVIMGSREEISVAFKGYFEGGVGGGSGSGSSDEGEGKGEGGFGGGGGGSGSESESEDSEVYGYGVGGGGSGSGSGGMGIGSGDEFESMLKLRSVSWGLDDVDGVRIFEKEVRAGEL